MYVIPFEEPVVALAVGEAGPSDANVLDQAQVGDLVLHALVVEHARRLNLVRLDAAHVERLFARQGLHEGDHRVLEHCPRRQRPLRRLTNTQIINID